VRSLQAWPPRYDAKNPNAIKSLLAKCMQLRWFPRDVMDAAFKHANDLYDELAETNEDFKKIYLSWKKFRDDQAAWY
jgi:TRAP-type mannitol/chloroaromatic compound transport system substrate-binding protein